MTFVLGVYSLFCEKGQTMFSKQQTQLIFERLLSGQFSVREGGSRCHQEYYVKDGQWFVDTFDEGAVDTYASSEASVRRLFEDKPQRFLHIWVNPLWRRLGEAFERGDWASAQEALDGLGPYCADGDEYKMWSCVLTVHHHERALDDVQLEWLVGAMRSYNAYHALCRVMGGDQRLNMGAQGVRWMQLLFEIVGEDVPYGQLQLGYFLVMKGEEARARRVFQARLEVLDGGPECVLLERELARLEEAS